MAETWDTKLCGILVLFLSLSKVSKAEFDPFMDAVPFSIRWSGPLDPSLESETSDDIITLPMMTKDKEKYQCRFRDDGRGDNNKLSDHPYDGPSAESILDTVSLKKACSYRVESFWTYELCHGKHLRQYHETPDPHSEDNVIVFPDYLLGNFKQYKPADKDNTILLDGVKYPYFSVEYDDGTVCDLTNVPRRTTIQYICHESGRGDVIQIKETSTCEYMAIVIVAELCSHPDYKAIRESSRVISCHPLDGAPNKPKMEMEIDTLLQQRKQTKPTSPTDNIKTVKPIRTTTKAELESTRTGIGKSEDEVFLQNFLNGEQCLQGGTGWWNFELCYGKTAKQFHVEKGKREVNILLGQWNKEEHLKWLEKFPHKKPKSKSSRRFIIQYYSGGDVCDATKKPRTVEVKLKCVSSVTANSHAVAIYLLEPKLCEYTLTVESAVLCDLVSRADDQGLIAN